MKKLIFITIIALLLSGCVMQFDNETTKDNPTGENGTPKNKAKIILLNESNGNTIIGVEVHPMFYMDDGKVKQYSSYDIDKNYYLAPIETSIKKDQSEEFTFTARLYPNENKI
jgi:protein involved in sex pheromone biosynthesis